MARRSPTDPNVNQLELLFDDPVQAVRHLFNHHGSDRELFGLVTAVTACIRDQCNDQFSDGDPCNDQYGDPCHEADRQ